MIIIDFVTRKEQGFLRPLSLRLVTPNNEAFSLKSKLECLECTALIVTAASHTCYLLCQYQGALKQLMSPAWLL